jgi:hypothetical protein
MCINLRELHINQSELACTVFEVSSVLQFKCEFSEEIQINELNLIVIEITFIIVPK